MQFLLAIVSMTLVTLIFFLTVPDTFGGGYFVGFSAMWVYSAVVTFPAHR